MKVYELRSDGVLTGVTEVPGPGWPPNTTPDEPPPIPPNYYAQYNMGTWTVFPGQIPLLPPPLISPTEQQTQNKTQASAILYETDWTTIPDVANPENTPYLINQDEFIAYRNVIRQIAVDPPTEPVNWPDQPRAQWSTDRP